MPTLVKTLSTSLDKLKRLVIKFQRYGLNDIQTSNSAQPFGLDGHPVKDMVAVYSQTDEIGKTVIIGYFNPDSLAEIGGNRLYSTDDKGVVKGLIYLRAQGDIEINGSTDNMVRFSEMEKAYNELKSDLNSLITAYNSHIHITTATVGATPTPGIITPTTSSGTPSSASIAGAKIDNVKTN